MAESTQAEQRDRLQAGLARYLATHSHLVAASADEDGSDPAVVQHSSVEVLDPVERLSQGWESDIWAFQTVQTNVQQAARTDLPIKRDWVARFYFGERASQVAQQEYTTYRLLADAGYPVPAAAGYEPDSRILGRPFLIMARVRGVTLGDRLRRAEDAAVAGMLDAFCGLHVRLHGLKWQEFPGHDALFRRDIQAQLARLADIGRQAPVAMLAPLLEWLESERRRMALGDETSWLGIVHGDFHPQNILADAQEDLWVIDWTQAQVTDVRFDLAWTLVLMGSEASWIIAEEIRRTYMRVAQEHGRRSDVTASLAHGHPAMNWFEAFACGLRMLAVEVSLQYGAEQLGMRPGAEAAMQGHLARVAQVYRRWLDITDVPLPEPEERLAAYL